MRIKKTSQYIEGGASLSNIYGTSQSNGYSQEYINGLNTYSTTEQRIGTAENGKPLYKKTFIDTTSSTQHANKVIGTIPNLDTVYHVYGGYKTNGGYGGPVPFYYVNKSNNTEYYLVVQNDPSNNIYAVSYYTSTSFVVTFEYTKTTDTAQNTRSISNDEVVDDEVEEEDNR